MTDSHDPTATERLRRTVQPLVFLPLREKGGGGKAALGWTGEDYVGVGLGDGVNRGLRLDGMLVADLDSPDAVQWWLDEYGPSNVVQKTQTPGHEQHFYAYESEERPTLVSLRPEHDVDIKFSRRQQVKLHDITLIDRLRDGHFELFPPPPQLLIRMAMQRPAAETHEGDTRLIHGEGDRHWPMVRLAGWLREQGYDEEAIFEVVMALNVFTFVPVLDEKWVRNIARSATQWEQGTPRENPVESGRAWQVDPTQIARPRWLWSGRIPTKALTLIGGRESVGKSTAAFDLAASLSAGTLPGEFKGAPRATLLMATEDSFETTITPRLIAAGADFEYIFRAAPLSIETELDMLEQIVTNNDIALVIFDPLISRLGKLDTYKDADVRQALEPMVQLADRTGAAIVGLIHVNKSVGTDMVSSLMGSRAFTAVPRSVLFAMNDPDPAAPKDQRVLANPMNNLAASAPTLTYSIGSKKVGEDDGPIIASKILWSKGDDPRSSYDLMTQANTGPAPVARESAMAFLTEELEANGPMLKSVLIHGGAARGHSESTLKRAKRELNLVTTLDDGKAIWALPE